MNIKEKFDNLHFIINGKAIPLARPRFTRAGHTYLPERSRKYRELIQQCALAELGQNWQPLDGALSVAITEIRKPPQRPKAQEPITRPDLDNIIKAVLDALNGLVWKDDAQVTVIQAEKRYGTPERLHVKITPDEQTKFAPQ